MPSFVAARSDLPENLRFQRGFGGSLTKAEALCVVRINVGGGTRPVDRAATGPISRCGTCTLPPDLRSL